MGPLGAGRDHSELAGALWNAHLPKHLITSVSEASLSCRCSHYFASIMQRAVASRPASDASATVGPDLVAEVLLHPDDSARTNKSRTSQGSG